MPQPIKVDRSSPSLGADSDPPTRQWRRFFFRFSLNAIGIGVIVAASLLVLDPYDTGRFALFGEHGVAKFGQRYTAASLARQPGFDAAIIGNSTIQLIDPARVGKASARRALSLVIPGTGPLEQISVADWLLHHHRDGDLRGLVVGIDDSWCRSDGKLVITNPFPFWLYAPSALDYAVHLIQLGSIEATSRKIKLLLGYAAAARSDGYNDYEIGRVWDAASAAQRLARHDGGETTAAPALPANFAAVPLLAQLLTRLPAETVVVLVMPPRHLSARPAQGSAAEAQAQACKERFAALISQRPHTQLLDFRLRPDMTERDEDYWDPVHYRAPIARKMEVEIAAALATPRWHAR